MKNVIEILQERGFIDQMTSEELHKHVMQPIRVYVGFDPTADSLHLGILMLAAEKGAKIAVEAVGSDAEAAVNAILKLAQHRFNIKY